MYAPRRAHPGRLLGQAFRSMHSKDSHICRLGVCTLSLECLEWLMAVSEWIMHCTVRQAPQDREHSLSSRTSVGLAVLGACGQSLVSSEPVNCKWLVLPSEPKSQQS